MSTCRGINKKPLELKTGVFNRCLVLPGMIDVTSSTTAALYSYPCVYPSFGLFRYKESRCCRCVRFVHMQTCNTQNATRNKQWTNEGNTQPAFLGRSIPATD
ncbi:unnamed protein product [Laminaria digitata]